MFECGRLPARLSPISDMNIDTRIALYDFVSDFQYIFFHRSVEFLHARMPQKEDRQIFELCRTRRSDGVISMKNVPCSGSSDNVRNIHGKGTEEKGR